MNPEGDWKEYDDRRSVTIHDDDGVKMGAIVEHLLSGLLEREHGDFYIEEYEERLQIEGCVERDSPWVACAKGEIPGPWTIPVIDLASLSSMPTT